MAKRRRKAKNSFLRHIEHSELESSSSSSQRFGLLLVFQVCSDEIKSLARRMRRIFFASCRFLAGENDELKRCLYDVIVFVFCFSQILRYFFTPHLCVLSCCECVAFGLENCTIGKWNLWSSDVGEFLSTELLNRKKLKLRWSRG